MEQNDASLVPAFAAALVSLGSPPTEAQMTEAS
jgi:hypothetical protein